MESTPEVQAPDTSLLDRLREKRRKLGETKSIYRDVPGYGGDLVVRYKWVPYEELASKGQKLQKIKNPTKRDLLAAADMLATLCDEICIRVGEEIRPLAEDGGPITFGDERLGEALGFELKSAREGVFGTFNNDYAVLAEAVALSSWLQDASREVDEEFQGY